MAKKKREIPEFIHFKQRPPVRSLGAVLATAPAGVVSIVSNSTEDIIVGLLAGALNSTSLEASLVVFVHSGTLGFDMVWLSVVIRSEMCV